MKPPVIFALSLGIAPLLAFPPAPNYTLYGTVRDQVGQTVSAEGAVLVLYRGTEEIGRAAINSRLWTDRNYQLQVKIDTNRPQTTLYNAKALHATGAFNLAVEMNGSLFYPIETSGGLQAGKGGESVRLDLNLGIDSDGDGLPDTWEEWQLYQSGHYPDENGWDLSLLDRNGDFDGDGKSNWDEYVAGTFAGDASDRFEIKIKEKVEEHIRFEFYAITGKTYTIERSIDGQVWTETLFSLSESGERFAVQTADTVAILSAYCAPSGSPKELFRMTVR